MKERLLTALAAAVLVMATVLWSLTEPLDPVGLAYLRQLAILAAAIGLVLILFQYMLAARIRVFETGFGLDRMLSRHRWVGRAGLIFLFLHLCLILAYRYLAFGTLLPNTYIITYIIIGSLSLTGFVVTGALASINKKIGLAYETWRGIHLLNYLLFPLALVHVFYYARPWSPLYYLWLAIALCYGAVILYRLVRILRMRKNPYEVMAVNREAEDAWNVCFRGKKIAYQPGQFLFLQLRRKGRLSAPHPFTMTSSPTRDELCITPKELGDFTSTIDQTEVGDRAYIDAPYGVFGLFHYGSADPVFIAGGIGITPFISMLRDLYDREGQRRVDLFWALRREEQFYFRDELETMAREMDRFNMVVVLSGQPHWPGEKGRLSAALVKQHLGEEMRNREFYLCGPPSMAAALTVELKQLGVPAKRIHREIFEL